ncbi:MAG TPA: acyltransferase family protein, partial [Acidimicrobiales bacterium]|nr:acyltransferase family protein [Acidimicrobiales bacterium]
LRAVAVLLVVIYHSDPHLLPGGFVGVNVFFVISGFLITRLLLAERETNGRVSFASFYARRARRILPAAGLTTIVTLAVSAILLTPLAAQRVVTDAFSATTFNMNYRLAIEGSDYLASTLPSSPLQHFWSLSVEEQFYALWPALLAITLWRARGRGRARLGITLGAVVAASLAASLWLTPRSPAWAYYALWTRAFELALGALLAVLLSNASSRRVERPAGWLAGAAVVGWAGVAAIGFAAAVFSGSTPFPGAAALAPALGTVAVIAGGSFGTTGLGPETILGLRPFRWLGARSYSWYLWHFPFLVLAPAALGRPLGLAGALATSMVALLVAALAFSFVEQPIRNHTTIRARPRRGLVVGAASVAGVSLGGLGVLLALPPLVGAGRPEHISSHFRTTSDQGLTVADLQGDLTRSLSEGAAPDNLTPSLDDLKAALPITYRDGCHLPLSQTVNPPCVFGDASSSNTVVLFGDSHAAQWFPALDDVSVAEHWRLVSLTKSGCTPVEVTAHRVPGDLPYPECSAWRSGAEARIDRMRPALVVVSWDRGLEQHSSADVAAPQGYGSYWADGVMGTLRALKASGAVVVLIEDTPRMGQDAPDCVSAHLADVSMCASRSSASVDLPGLAVQELRVAALAGVHVVDPISWFCTPARCPVVVGNILVYRDDQHMTAQYSRFIAPLLADALTPLLQTS